MDECLKGKELNRKTCRFVKKCKEGFIRNTTSRCRKIKNVLPVKSKDKTNEEIAVKSKDKTMEKIAVKSKDKTIEEIPVYLATPVQRTNQKSVTPKNYISDTINQTTDEIPEEVRHYITDSKKAKSLPLPIRKYLSIKNNSLPLTIQTPPNKISFSEEKMKKAVIDLGSAHQNVEYKTVYPDKYEIIKENDKTYLEFKNGGTGIMLADSLYKDGKIASLTKKQLETHINPTVGWYASEKYDGLRGLWTGKEMISRPLKKGNSLKGKIFNYCPEWFIKLLPPGISLDGEIWMGRGFFQEVSGLSNLKLSGKRNKEEIDKIWEKVKYMVFDIPSEKNKPFIERTKILKKIIDDITIKYGPNCPIVYSTLTYIDSEETLTKVYNDYTANGAEGIVIREPNSLYENKRSKLMLKMKICDDGEAIVVGYILGKGRLDGLLGSLKCKLKDGKTFNIGSGLNDIIRKEYNNPESIYYIPLDSIVNFSYMEKTKEGVPRHPIYRGIRTDVGVNDIL